MTQRQRLTLVAAILGSGVATLDGTIVNVALPAIERDLGGGLTAQQWVVNAYLLALGSLILIGGSLGDIYGERRIFTVGVVAFGVFSVACALAPTIGVLIAARALQGAAAALLMPSSLAIIIGAFSAQERGPAIGTLDRVERDRSGRRPAGGRRDRRSGVVALGVRAQCPVGRGDGRARSRGRAANADGGRPPRRRPWRGPLRDRARRDRLRADRAAAARLVEPCHRRAARRRRSRARRRFSPTSAAPRSPCSGSSLFARRNFSVGNIETLAMYAGLAILFFYLVIFLQQVAGYSALEAGLATLPTTLIMFSLSSRFGALADRYGPRLFMGAGPLIAAAGILLLLRTGLNTSYVADVLPAVLVFSLGLTMTVAPLTATVLADADETDAGIASAVNNAVARVAGLVGVPIAGVVAASTLVGDTFVADGASVDAFHRVVVICAALVAAGGAVGALGIANPRRVVEARRCAGGQLVGVPEPAVGRRPRDVTHPRRRIGAFR